MQAENKNGIWEGYNWSIYWVDLADELISVYKDNTELIM